MSTMFSFCSLVEPPSLLLLLSARSPHDVGVGPVGPGRHFVVPTPCRSSYEMPAGERLPAGGQANADDLPPPPPAARVRLGGLVDVGAREQIIETAHAVPALAVGFEHQVVLAVVARVAVHPQQGYPRPPGHLGRVGEQRGTGATPLEPAD